jgi:hypothetical protein
MDGNPGDLAPGVRGPIFVREIAMIESFEGVGSEFARGGIERGPDVIAGDVNESEITVLQKIDVALRGL